jgi:hypothetical protein
MKLSEEFEKEFGTMTDYFNHRTGVMEEIKKWLDNKCNCVSEKQCLDFVKKAWHDGYFRYSDLMTDTDIKEELEMYVEIIEDEIKKLSKNTKIKVRYGVCAECKNPNIEKEDWCFHNCMDGDEFKL